MDSYVQLYWSLCVVGGLVGLAAGIEFEEGRRILN